MIRRIKDKIQGKAPTLVKRSSFWPTVRREQLLAHPSCAACGGVEKLEVHHIKSFHEFPEDELRMENLLTLCEGLRTKNCHLLIGHGGSHGGYKVNNPNVVADAAYWLAKATEFEEKEDGQAA